MSGGLSQMARVQDAANYELRHRNVIEARRHLASMTPERRAMLEAEWDDTPSPPHSGAPVTVPGSNAATLWKNGAR